MHWRWHPVQSDSQCVDHECGRLLRITALLIWRDHFNVFLDGNWRPDSYYDKIVANRKMGFHTLCLLDIKVKEQTVENLMRGNGVYEPPRFMTTHQVSIEIETFEYLQNLDYF